MPPAKKRTVALYDARMEFYQLYEILNKEKFNGELPWVKIYLNGRLNSKCMAKFYCERVRKTKELISCHIEISDRLQTTCAPTLLHEMCHFKEMLDKGKSDDKSEYFIQLCNKVGAPINDVPYDERLKNEIDAFAECLKSGWEGVI
jgi:hypothetical protein